MPTVSDVRYFEFTTLDALVKNKDLEGTTVAPFIVPPGMKWLIGMAPQYSAPGSTTGSSGVVIELAGQALKGTSTPLQIPAGAFGATLATTHSTPSRSGYIPTNIPVKEGLNIDAVAILVGVDTGDGVAQLELEFSDKPRSGWPTVWQYQTLEGIVAAVDTPTELEEAGAAKKFLPSKEDRFIRQLITAATGDSSGVGSQCTALRLTGKGIDIDQQFCLDGSGGTHATEANGHAEARVRNIEVKVNGNQPITAHAIMSGADTGNVIVLAGVGITET